MKEKNHERLREALNKLPGYDAPQSNWDGIAEGLTPTLSDQLPSYTPPAGVWNNLSRELEVEATAQTAKRRRLWPRAIAGAAAALALLITLGLGLQNGIANKQKVTVAYSQEAAPAQHSIDWQEGEESFAFAIAEIEARNEPKLNNLRHELDELTEAREEIKIILAAYGEDPQVIRQLAKIERDRSDIYRRIIVELNVSSTTPNSPDQLFSTNIFYKGCAKKSIDQTNGLLVSL
ncbi:MAG: hypothetical protein AAF840_09140 [Bacteroidota bacterium]